MATRTGEPIKVANKLSTKQRSALKRKLKVLNKKLKSVGHKLNKVDARIEILQEEAQYQAQVQNTLESIYDGIDQQILHIMEQLADEGKNSGKSKQ